MALEFVQDAISLSGLTGSKLKSEIIAEYYPFWWKITSGGDKASYSWATAIVELDAATGEMYIKDTHETILGSAGHALSLKCDNKYTKKLTIILVEKDLDCYSHLKNVIRRRWATIDINVAEGPLYRNRSNIYLMNLELEEAIGTISQVDLGNSLFFFDPLRSVPFEAIEKVARSRIKTYFQTGTEFILFVFTSDWFLGRGDFAALPKTTNEENWSDAELNTVEEADALFGHEVWRSRILCEKQIHEKEIDFIDLYKTCLHKWFRYVLPMPFNPKGRQIFHLILCSNFEAGVHATKGFFCERTDNPEYKPDNNSAYRNFRNKHSETYTGLRGNQRPKQWLMLWRTITGHEEGYCDYLCRDFEKIEPDEQQREGWLRWLASKGYLIPSVNDNPWNMAITQYQVNWDIVRAELGIEPPNPLEPLSLRRTSLKDIGK
jgi:three-Cys-motif partner protein